MDGLTAVLAGQVLGLAVACGLNLYLVVAALGTLARLDVVAQLPPGLQGLEGLIVIASATALYLVETVLDKTPPLDALWDSVHTFIRPPAAALLAVAILWGQPIELTVLAAGSAFLAALAVHSTKAGLRLALATTMRGGQAWISVTEDLLAFAFAMLAFLEPRAALIGSASLLLVIAIIGPPYWRAGRLGVRCFAGWLRSLFAPRTWREHDRLPRGVRRLLPPTPLGSGPPRGARAGLDAPGVGSFRNGWLIVTDRGAEFVFRGPFGRRRISLPAAHDVDIRTGIWADILRVEAGEQGYTLYLPKDGPPLDLVAPMLARGEPSDARA